MNKMEYQIEGTTMEALDQEFVDKGFEQIQKPTRSAVSSDERRTIQKYVQPEFRGMDLELVTRRAEYAHGEDRVVVLDFTVRRVRARKILATDPIVVVEEEVPGRTSAIVEELLDEANDVDVVYNAIHFGITSNAFAICAQDKARLLRMNPQEVYEYYSEMFTRACIEAIKNERCKQKPLSRGIQIRDPTMQVR
jgi:hypothetical protein